MIFGTLLAVAAATTFSAFAGSGGGGGGGCTYGSSWETVDEFQLVADRSSSANAITSAGNAVYAVGVAQTDFGSGSGRWIVRRSLNGGASWQTIDNFKKGEQQSEPFAIAISPTTGNLFVAGYSVERFPPPVNTLVTHWIIRRSTNGGATWAVVDDFFEGAAFGAAADAAGNIYVSGFAVNVTTKVAEWVVRRSTDGGATWKNVDLVSGGASGLAHAVVVTPSGGVFVGGNLRIANDQTWTVRYSPDGATGWQTVDSFKLAPNKVSSANGGAVVSFAMGGGTSVAFVGLAEEASGKRHWIARQASAANPSAWQTVDDYFPSASDAIIANAEGAAFSPGGMLVVTGERIFNGRFDDFLTRANASNIDAVTGSPRFEDEDQTSGLGVTFDEEWGVYAAGRVSRGPATRWLVRKLTCWW